MVAVFPQKHLTDIAEWHRMGEADIFPADSRLELIEGEILRKSPIGSNHAGHIARLINFLVVLIQGQAIANEQNLIQLGDLSEPQPDFVLLRPEASFYTTRHPVAVDVLLLVEVSDSTLRFDRSQKLHLYAHHAIPEYWIVNLIDNCLEVYRQPQDGDYLDQTLLFQADSLTLQALPDVRIAVSSIL